MAAGKRGVLQPAAIDYWRLVSPQEARSEAKWDRRQSSSSVMRRSPHPAATVAWTEQAELTRDRSRREGGCGPAPGLSSWRRLLAKRRHSQRRHFSTPLLQRAVPKSRQRGSAAEADGRSKQSRRWLKSWAFRPTLATRGARKQRSDRACLFVTGEAAASAASQAVSVGVSSNCRKRCSSRVV